MTRVNLPTAPSTTPTAADLDAARLLLARLGVSPTDLLTTPPDHAPAPRFADYIPVVRAAVSNGTRRVYGSYWNRITEHWGTRRLDEPTPSEIQQLAERLKANVVMRRGGRGATEHLIAALRCLYRHAEDDGRITAASNPARKVAKAPTAALDPPRRPRHPTRRDQPHRHHHRQRPSPRRAAATTAHRNPLSHGPSMEWRHKYQLGRLVPTRLQLEDVHLWTKWTTRIKDSRVDGIDIAIRRILRAISERSEPEDILVDAVIAWENLFGSNQETVLRVTSTLAWLIEPDSSTERSTLQSRLKKLYNLRSGVVHGKVKRSAALKTEPQEAVSIALQSLAILFEHRSDLLALDGSDSRSNALILGA